MPREIPLGLEAPARPIPPPRASSVVQLPVSVMTVLYGGGVVAGESDPITPFRGTSIRGHLRFWWRATKGAACRSARELLEAESAIWGATDLASPVRIRVLKAQRGAGVPAAHEEVRAGKARLIKERPEYVLFPAQEDRKDIGDLYTGGQFTLEIKAPEGFIDDVSAALWAWFTFGGIGARTRRGVGALFSPDYFARLPFEQYFQVCSQNFCVRAGGRDWPILSGARVLVSGERSSWRTCWEKCIEPLRSFRQPATVGAPERWPEADHIRRLVQNPDNKDAEFPRAALGLPIVFHFRSGYNWAPEHTLYPKGDKERMASPVILRPLAVSASQAVPMLVALNVSEPPQDLVLKGGKDNPRNYDVQRGDRPVIDELIARAESAWRTKAFTL